MSALNRIEQLLPQEIEKRSFEIIGEELAAHGIVLPKEQEMITKRVIHTSADFEYTKTLTYSQDAVRIAEDLICEGADIVTDTNMALAGINKRALATFGGEAHCFMADPAVARLAKERHQVAVWRTTMCPRPFEACVAFPGNWCVHTYIRHPTPAG